MSVTNNIDIPTCITDTTLQSTPQTKDTAVQGWKGLKLQLQQGLENAGWFYQELLSKIGEAIGVADGEPIWNSYLGQWQVWVSFADGCRSVRCDWLVAV